MKKKKGNGETEKRKTLEKTSIMIDFSRITWCQKKRIRSHFGSSCGNACKAPSVPFSISTLLASWHWTRQPL